MKSLTVQTLKFIGFWLLLFFVQRTVFILFQSGQLTELTFSDFWSSNRHAFAMDVSMTSYFMALPILFIIAILFIYKNRNLNRSPLKYYFILLIVFSSFIHIIDLGLFTEWGSKMNRKAMSYLAFPDKVLVSTLSTPIVPLLSILVVQCIAGIWFYVRFIHKEVIVQSKLLWKITYSLLLIAAMILGIRGGVQEFPIDKSWSYFSKHNMLNLASVNSTWNFMELAILNKDIDENPYQYFENGEATKIFSDLHQAESESVVSISKVEKPNILVILLESWSGDIIAPLGGEHGVSPQFTRLCNDGILFTNFYSTGFRTEQGQVALISGFPAQPTTTIMRKFGKFDKLPSLTNELHNANYYNAYYYSGDLNFANTETYLQAKGFDLIFGEEDFDFETGTAWGAYDEDMFDFNIEHMKSIPRPFFSIIMTATSHEPFDAPLEEGFEGKKTADLYRNTVHYTDRVMGNYMDQAKLEDWYDNTLIVIVSDHAHRFPKNRKRHDPMRHHIPFLITGGALKEEFRGTIHPKVGSHLDFPSTLLSQLNLPADKFKYSKDLFNPEPAFAFYTFEDGFGWINKEQTVVYDHQLGEVILYKDDLMVPEEKEKHLRNGKAYLQVVMNDYIDFN